MPARAALLALVVLAVAVAAAALAQTNPVAPRATTGAARDVTQTTATLTGDVDPQGSATTYRFEYGTSTAYGLVTPETAAGDGVAEVAVTVPVTALTAGTTYHFRLVATNAAGVARGADATLTTPAAPGAPGTITDLARNLTTSSARLRARVDPNGLATTYRFEYGTTTAYGAATPEASAGSGTAAASVAAVVEGLQPRTTYNFRVVATNAAGVTRGRNRTFTTLRAPTSIEARVDVNPVRWSASTTISGRVLGQGVVGARVALERQDFPFSSPLAPFGATVPVGSDGSFRFTLGPLWATARVRVVSGTSIVVASPVLEIANRVTVGLRALRPSPERLTLLGSINPAVPAGRASLQKRSPSGRWVPIVRGGVEPLAGNRSRYSFTIDRGRRAAALRVVVLPNDAGAHVRGESRVLSLAARRRPAG